LDGDHFSEGQIIDTVTPRHGNTIVNDRCKRAEPVWDPDEHPGAWRAVWQYSARRARRDQQTLNAQDARAKAVIDGDRPVKATRFVKVHVGFPRTVETSPWGSDGDETATISDPVIATGAVS
jgi:hypothetical protein